MDASAPVSSASRLAARPVGAASTTFACLARASSTMDRTVNDLPQPGPPVRTADLLGERELDGRLLLGREVGARTRA
ncbi:hypothetical protein STENM223S_06983 [Streptomyces tendae]